MIGISVCGCIVIFSITPNYYSTISFLFAITVFTTASVALILLISVLPIESANEWWSVMHHCDICAADVDCVQFAS